MNIRIEDIKPSGPENDWFIISIKRENELDKQEVDRIETCLGTYNDYSCACAIHQIITTLQDKKYKVVDIYEEVFFLEEEVLDEKRSESSIYFALSRKYEKGIIIKESKIIPVDGYVFVIEDNPLEKEDSDTPF